MGTLEVKDTMLYTNLSDFIDVYLRDNDLSARELADKVGVTHTTINNWRNPKSKDAQNPKIGHLIALARVTGENVLSLIALVHPEINAYIAALTSVHPEVLFRSQLLEELPQGDIDMLDTLIEQRVRAQRKKQGS